MGNSFFTLFRRLTLDLVNDYNVPEKWSEWKEMWEQYSIASKVNKEDGEVQVAALLTFMLICPEDRNVFKTWNLTAAQVLLNSSTTTGSPE